MDEKTVFKILQAISESERRMMRRVDELEESHRNKLDEIILWRSKITNRALGLAVGSSFLSGGIVSLIAQAIRKI